MYTIEDLAEFLCCPQNMQPLPESNELPPEWVQQIWWGHTYQDGIQQPKVEGLGLPGISWGDFAAALTDPNKRFEFPIKPFETDLTTGTKLTLIGTGALIGIPLLILAINSRK